MPAPSLFSDGGAVQQPPFRPHLHVRQKADIFAQVIQRRTNTSGFLHNHPSGDPKPSGADVAITIEIAAAADTLGVLVHDHLLIGRHGAASMKSLGLM